MLGSLRVGEPFDLGRDVGELVELGGGQQPGNTGRGGGELVGHSRIGLGGSIGGFPPLKSVIKKSKSHGGGAGNP